VPHEYPERTTFILRLSCARSATPRPRFHGPSSALSAAAPSRVSAPHEVERVADDRGRVDAVDGMGLTHRGGLTEIADAEVADAVAPDPGEEGQGVRVTVEHGHRRRRMGGGEQRGGRGR